METEPLIAARPCFVRWLDSVMCNHGGWNDLDDVKDALTAEALGHESVGFVVAESDVSLLIAQSRDANRSERWMAVLAIPKSAIIERKEL